jgi:hypothetical protein
MVVFFAWSAALEKILIMDNLKKQHIIVDRYCMCKSEEESVDYLLLLCEMASAFWNTIFSLVVLAWIMPS